MADLQIVYCVSCGSTLNSNFRICPSCGGQDFSDTKVSSSTDGSKLKVTTGDQFGFGDHVSNLTKKPQTQRRTRNKDQETNFDTNNLTNYAVWSLYINIFFLCAGAYSSFLLYDFLTDISKGMYQTEILQNLAEKHDRREQITGIFTSLSYVICFLIIGRWIFISSKLKHASGAKELKFSPTWSISWYFIPIANLWKPYQALKELYQVSIDSVDRKNVITPFFLKLWWGLWISSAIIGQIQLRIALSSSASSLGEMKWVALSYVIHLPFDIWLNLVFIKILKEISSRQNSKR